MQQKYRSFSATKCPKCLCYFGNISIYSRAKTRQDKKHASNEVYTTLERAFLSR